MKIKQVIVVEGKTDTSKLKEIFGDIDTIETNGFNLNKKILNLIADINKSRGIIIFTDPDGPGIKIRDKINSHLDYKCFNAFVDKNNIKNKKIGIAEASDEDIKLALENIILFDKVNNNISWSDFLNNNFFIKENRKKIAKKFNWNENINSKKLFNWLNLININIEDINKIIGEE